ncbi:MAG: hypothetical protein ABI896_06025 [Actinomycetota bacterium]
MASRAMVQRLLGAALVIVGCLILVVDATRLDVVVLSLTRKHGLHLSDLLGTAAVAAGVAILWTAPPR